MNIYEKLSIVQSRLKAPKNQKNKFGNYNYRNVEDILEAAKPLLFENKLSLVIGDKPILVHDRVYVEATAVLTDIEKPEHQIISTSSARESLSKKGMDDSQITGSTSSYARKYCLNGLFNIDDTKDADFMDNSDHKTTSGNPNFLKKMKEYAKNYPEAYWEVMNKWQIKKATQITDPTAQEGIIMEITMKIGKAA